MKKTMVVLLMSLVLGALGMVPLIAQSGETDITTLVAGGTMGSVNSSAAFTSGADSTVTGNVVAAAAVTLGADAVVTGNVTVGADFTSGANSIVRGNVWVTGDVTLGAGSRILGSVHSGSGTITYGSGASVGSVK
jgi:UDP-3-O-[3-hydroxymyristoyl] glucosamine N-acyltransferase